MQWKKIPKENYSIDYEDQSLPSSRSYGHPGRLLFDGKDATLGPDPRQLTGILAFGLFFIPLFSLSGYLFIPDDTKWFVVLGGPALGTLTFTLIYYLIKQDVDAGPYIQFFQDTNEIVLQRIGKRFNKDDVTLQWITGRLENDNDIETDLNLIVNDGVTIIRYFVMGGPYRKYVKEFAQHAHIPVIEINMGWNGRRDLDRESLT